MPSATALAKSGSRIKAPPDARPKLPPVTMFPTSTKARCGRVSVADQWAGGSIAVAAAGTDAVKEAPAMRVRMLTQPNRFPARNRHT